MSCRVVHPSHRVPCFRAPSFALLALSVLLIHSDAEERGAKVALISDVAPDPDFEPKLRAAGCQVVVTPASERDWEKLSQFHVWLILDWSPEQVDPELLRRFLEAGGGVFISIFSTDIIHDRFPAWNALLGPYGAAARREQVVDREHQWVQPRWGRSYAWTTHFAESPITEGLSALWYPDHTQNRQGLKLGNSCLVVDQHWIPVVRTMPSGGAFALTATGAPDFDRMTQASPPLLAVREVGRGRLAVQSFPAFYNFSGGYTLMVDGIVMERGDGLRRSDGAVLLLNTFRWLAEPALAAGIPDGWKPEKPLPQKPWPGPAVRLDQWEWMRPVRTETHQPTPPPVHHFRGLLGAHTALSNGTGSVAEQGQAAMAAGYDFIIFTEHLGEMTAEKYARLVSECKAASSARFLAVPGLDVQVQPWGNPRSPLWKYLLFGFERFPESRHLSEDGKLFAHQFDNWYFAEQAPGVAVHSLSERGLPGWFYAFYNCFSLFTYRSGELRDDAVAEFMRVADNGAYLLPVVTHLCYSVEDIGRARQAAFQFYVNVRRQEKESPADYRGALESVVSLLRFGEGTNGGFRSPQPCFVSSGPLLEEYTMAGGYPADLQYLDRLRLVAGVSSEADLAAISIFDGDRPYRRYAVSGRHATVSAEDYASRYWHFVVQASDAAGGRMVSSMMACGSWLNWARMCTDQQNIIAGPHLYFKGHSTLVRLPTPPPNAVRFWAGEGDDGPDGANWNVCLCADVDESGGLKAGNLYAPPEFHLDLASPHVNVVHADQRWKGGREQAFEGPADPLRLHVRIHTFYPAMNQSWKFADYYRPCPPQVGWALVEGEAELTRDVSPRPEALVNLLLVSVDGGNGEQCVYSPADSIPTKCLICKRPDSGWKRDGRLAEGGMLMIAPVTTGAFCLYPLTSGLSFSLRQNGGGWNLLVGFHLDGVRKKGERFPVRFALGRGIPGNRIEDALAAFQSFAASFAFSTPQPFFRLKPKMGRIRSMRGILDLDSEDNGFLGRLEGADQRREVVGVRIHGLTERWDAGVVVPERQWLRRIGFVEKTGYTSLDQTEPKATFYIGNLLVCDNPQVDLRLIDATKAWCRFQAHNSGPEPATITVRPARGFQKVYPIPRFAQPATIPPGVTLTLEVGTRPKTPRWEHVYDGVDTQHTTGVMTAADHDAQAVQVRVARAGIHKPGFLLHELWSSDEPAGQREAVFRLKVPLAGGDSEVARIEVLNRTCDVVLQSRLLLGSDFKKADKFQDFSLAFDRPMSDAMDYRVYWFGSSDLCLDTVTVK
ncbi:MAG: hypothetical protein HYU36_23665 [Planctomycetes bacterium]|nr:hypothetical protein [Planctomycetota bacterium]